MDQSETMISQNMLSEAVAQKNFLQKWGWYASLALVVILFISALWWFNLFSFNPTAAKYQAVFLSNGQVYFGQLEGEKGDYALLANIFYFQQINLPVQQAASVQKDGKSSIIQQPASTVQPNIQLVKLGSELHGPEDKIYISKSQILFYEDLKDDSRVVQAIKAFKK